MGKKSIRMGVAFIPNDYSGDEPTVYIVVDVIRATSSIVTLFEQECSQIFLTDTVKNVHDFHQSSEERFLICAEDAIGQRLEGADFSPSLSEIHSRGSFSGDRVVIQTSNGTAAMHKLVSSGSEDVFIGSMLNIRAVTEAAMKTALEKGADLVIVCAGRNTGRWVTLDDVYCAAKILDHAITWAKESDISLTLFDSARLAHSQLSVYPDAVSALTDSASAENLRRIEMTGDIPLCAKENISLLAPRIHQQTTYPFIEIRRD